MVLNGGRLVGGGGRSGGQKMKKGMERVVKWYRVKREEVVSE